MTRKSFVSGLTAGLTAGAITRTDGRTDLRRSNYLTVEILTSVTHARAYRIDLPKCRTAPLRGSREQRETA